MAGGEMFGVKLLFGTVPVLFRPLQRLGEDFSEWVTANQSNLILMAVGIAVTFVIAAILGWIFDRILKRFAGGQRAGNLDNSVIGAVRKPLIALILLSGIFGSISLLRGQHEFLRGIVRIYYALAILIIVWGALRVLNVISAGLKRIADKTGNTFDNLLIDLMRRVAKVTIWTIALLFIAQNIFQLNVSAMLAGAGVIGLAVAFAAQNTIANIFGAVTLILDKPFTVGDRVIIGDRDGIVENVGLRSTRLRALDGTLWVIPNKEMSDASIQNFSRRPNFKQFFELGLVYSTPPEKMARAVELLHEILDGHRLFDMEKLPPRVYFTDFKDWSLNIMVIVWFQTLDYFEMMTEKEKLNLEILRRFNAEGLEFAFPSHTAYLAGDPAHPVALSGETVKTEIAGGHNGTADIDRRG